MRILIACEESGVVREAFRKRGHDAWSCDLMPSRIPGPHLQGDVFKWMSGKPGVCSTTPFEPWDMLLAFPPCTYLLCSGMRWFTTIPKRPKPHVLYGAERAIAREDAAKLFLALAGAHIERVCVENPIGIMSTRFRKPDQIIQPWQFGHGETKATCLWLKGLPLLVPTNIVPGREARIHKMRPGPNRSRDRSVTYQDIADAMAEQWGNLK